MLVLAVRRLTKREIFQQKISVNYERYREEEEEEDEKW